jgi:hypothetical protein
MLEDPPPAAAPPVEDGVEPPDPAELPPAELPPEEPQAATVRAAAARVVVAHHRLRIAYLHSHKVEADLGRAAWCRALGADLLGLSATTQRGLHISTTYGAA